MQSSLLGSILANLLLILGMSFLIGGLRYREQLYNSTVTHMSASLMALAVLSLLLPTVFYASFKKPREAEGKILAISRGSAAILLLVYALYLVFQLKSHAYMYTSTPQQVVDEESRPGSNVSIEMLGISRCARSSPGGTPPSLPLAESHSIGRFSSVLLLFVSTALVAICAKFMVDSLDDLVEKGPLGEMFIGLIILPVLGNAAEHFTAVKIAWKNNIDLAIGIAIGSSIQIALLVTPIIVLIGWAIEKELTLHFHLFGSMALFLAAYVVNFLVLDGRSNFLEGALLCAAYVMIGQVNMLNSSERKC